MSSRETKKPDYIVSFVPTNNKKRWTECGVAFTHKDGEGINLVLDFIPNGDGRIVLRSLASVEALREQSANEQDTQAA